MSASAFAHRYDGLASTAAIHAAIARHDFQIPCECSFEMSKPLFLPISARALKHNQKSDTGKNPCPHIVGHT